VGDLLMFLANACALLFVVSLMCMFAQLVLLALSTRRGTFDSELQITIGGGILLAGLLTGALLLAGLAQPFE
jgi:hypothetical protein